MNKIGKYTIVNKIGEGSYGVVYRVKDMDNQHYALKILENLSKKRRFFQEMEIVSSLEHENIIKVIDISAVGKKYYICTEIFEEGDLRRVISKKSIDNFKALSYFQDICRGVKYLHEHSIIHRDIKPENILVKEGKAVITDFGISKNVDSKKNSKLTLTGELVGTLAYMSPEQLKGDKIDRRSDIFSAGVVLYELLTKKHPFIRESSLKTIKAIYTERPMNPHVFDNKVSEDISTICMKCLEKKKKRRYQSFSEILNDIKKVNSGYYIKSSEFSFYDLLEEYKFQFAGVGLLLLSAIGGIMLNRYYDHNSEKLIKKNILLEKKIRESINQLEKEKELYKRKYVVSNLSVSVYHNFSIEKVGTSEEIFEEIMRLKPTDQDYLKKIKLYYQILEKVESNVETKREVQHIHSIKEKVLEKMFNTIIDDEYIFEKYVDFAFYSINEENIFDKLAMVARNFAKIPKFSDESEMLSGILDLYVLTNKEIYSKYNDFNNRVKDLESTIKNSQGVNENIKKMLLLFLNKREYELLQNYVKDEKRLENYSRVIMEKYDIHSIDLAITKYYYSFFIFENCRVDYVDDFDIEYKKLENFKKINQVFADQYFRNKYNEERSLVYLESFGFIDVTDNYLGMRLSSFKELKHKVEENIGKNVYVDYINRLYGTSDYAESMASQLKGTKVGRVHEGIDSTQLVGILDSSVLVEESTKHYLQGINNFLDRIESSKKHYEGRFAAYFQEKERCTKLYRVKEILKASEKISKDEKMFGTEIGEKSKNIYLKALEIKKLLERGK